MHFVIWCQSQITLHLQTEYHGFGIVIAPNKMAAMKGQPLHDGIIRILTEPAFMVRSAKSKCASVSTLEQAMLLKGLCRLSCMQLPSAGNMLQHVLHQTMSHHTTSVMNDVVSSSIVTSLSPVHVTVQAITCCALCRKRHQQLQIARRSPAGIAIDVQGLL